MEGVGNKGVKSYTDTINLLSQLFDCFRPFSWAKPLGIGEEPLHIRKPGASYLFGNTYGKT